MNKMLIVAATIGLLVSAYTDITVSVYAVLSMWFVATACSIKEFCDQCEKLIAEQEKEWDE